MKLFRYKSLGVSLVEAILGVSILSLSMVGAITTFNLVIKSWTANIQSVQTSYLLAEGMEIVYFIRDSSWSGNFGTFSPGTKYYFTWQDNNWATTTTASLIDGVYDRYLMVDPVYRDFNGDIADSGVLDADSRKATIYVARTSGGGTITTSFSTYVFKLKDN